MTRPDPSVPSATLAAQTGAPPDLQLLVMWAAHGICRDTAHVHGGVTVTPVGGVPETVAATDDLPVRADWLQHELGQGPDVTPDLSEVVVIKDLAADGRWPDFGRMCVAVLGLRSLVSVEIPVPGAHATMNFFASDPTAFDDLDVDPALQAVPLAGPAARAAIDRLQAVAAALGDEAPGTSGFSQMSVALSVVMAQCRVGPTDGFSLLRCRAADLGEPLVELAAGVVRLGRLPENPAETSGGPDHASAHAGRVGGPSMWRARAASPAPDDPPRLRHGPSRPVSTWSPRPRYDRVIASAT